MRKCVGILLVLFLVTSMFAALSISAAAESHAGVDLLTTEGGNVYANSDDTSIVEAVQSGSQWNVNVKKSWNQGTDAAYGLGEITGRRRTDLAHQGNGDRLLQHGCQSRMAALLFHRG